MNTRLQVEHPITEEITGVDLVEQQLLIAAGYPLDFKQADIKINGHSVEYRVYAEDPARKFLPSIGFLKKYKEPAAHENIRIDTGVQEGSEISMYYDPMISKLITWGKDRKTAMDLIAKAMDEYVIRGVIHNLGFGQSIVRNKAFAEANYSTAFIPTYYPNGYKADPLTKLEHTHLGIASHYLRNLHKDEVRLINQDEPKHDNVLYMVLKEGENDHDFKVERQPDNSYVVTDLLSGIASNIKADNFDFEYGALLRFDADGERHLIQFEETREEVIFHYSVKGSQVEALVLTPAQYRLKGYMAKPKKVDHAKSVLSPMPGAIVSINLEVGQTVVEGQELFVIEAMKMQNIIKSSVEGKIKKIHIKAGVSVSVDQLLIEFE